MLRPMVSKLTENLGRKNQNKLVVKLLVISDFAVKLLVISD